MWVLIPSVQSAGDPSPVTPCTKKNLGSDYSQSMTLEEEADCHGIRLRCILWKLTQSFFQRPMFSMAAESVLLLPSKALASLAHSVPWRGFFIPVSAVRQWSILGSGVPCLVHAHDPWILSPLHTGVVSLSNIAMAASHVSASSMIFPSVSKFALWT